MANFNDLALTVNGVKALLAAQTGMALKLSKIGMGSGSTTNSTKLTKLVTPKLMLPISEKKTDGESGLLTIIAKMTNEDLTEGFYWRETGLFFEDSAGNDVLFAYACVTDQYDYVPAYSDQRYVKHIRIANIITDSANVTVQEREGLLYVDTLTFSEFKENLISHIGNKSNPHGVTKAQVGLGNVDNTSDANKPVSTLQQVALDTYYQQSVGYTDNKIADLINGAPETLDTLGEIATAMQENQSVVDALDAAIGNKANKAELDTHTGNETIHITASERDSWNSKAQKNHASTETEYGVASSIEYGHVKLSDNYNDSAGNASSSVGASSYALAKAYQELAAAIIEHQVVEELSCKGLGDRYIYIPNKAGYKLANVYNGGRQFNEAMVTGVSYDGTNKVYIVFLDIPQPTTNNILLRIVWTQA